MDGKICDIIRSKSIPNDDTKALIRVNTQISSSLYLDADDFRNTYMNYIINKHLTNSKKTEASNNLQVVKAMNVLYLDGDWIFSEQISKSEYPALCQDLMDLCADTWLDVLDQFNVSNCYDFRFIPDEFPKRKGGFHCFVYCPRIITMDERERLYAEVEQRLTNDEGFLSMVDMFAFSQKELETDGRDLLKSHNFYSKLFDIGPIKTAQTLLPFAEKKEASRHYVLISTSFNYDDPQETFIIPVQHRQNEFAEDITATTMIHPDISAIPDEEGEVPPNEDIENAINELMNEQQEKDKFDSLGLSGKIIAEFMNSLAYLSSRHCFWDYLADNEKRLRYVITPLIRFLAVNYFIERKGSKPNRHDFCVQVTTILKPLLDLTVDETDKTTKRNTYKSCYEHVLNYYMKYTDVENGLFKAENIEFWVSYCEMKPKDKKNMSYDERKKLVNIQTKFTKFYGCWFDFITKIILGGMTDEIKPFVKKVFSEDNPREGVIFDNVLPEQISVNKQASIETPFYIETLQRWCRMFIIEEFYNNGSLSEAIRRITSAFTRYFIWCSKNGKNNKIYIYNIRQTVQLRSYPYNQWLYDANDGDLLKGWIKNIYLQIIKPNLLRIKAMSGLMPLLNNLKIASDGEGGLDIRAIKPLANFEKDIKSLYDNILSAFEQEHWNPPTEIDSVSSNWLPMRNGLLEFLPNGDVKLHTENHKRYMNTYSNIVWDDKYDYSCDEFKKVSQMWEQIFPIAEERDYCLKIFASVLNGSILKDMLLIQYGKGGDGKTVSNNAMLGLLGTSNLTSGTTIEENGKINVLQLPTGMATTMKTETILISSKQTHDSGGIIMLKNKRFCTVQEPDPNVSNGKLNCSRIKEILSGASITAREIYQGAEQFTPNAVLTLQTNILLSYTEDTDAIRRRITVIPYRSKFTTEIQGDKFNTLEYKFVADPNISNSLINNPKYWQALFHTLLPLAQELTRKNIKALSDIPRPESIIKETNDSFSSSNGIVGWLAGHIQQGKGKVLSVMDVYSRVMDANNANKSNKLGSILEKTNVNDQRNEVIEQLTQTFMGRIYKLRNEYYNRRHNGLQDGISSEVMQDWVLGELTEKGYDINDCETEEVNQLLINQYFDKYAVNSMEASDLSTTKADLFILGYEMKTE